MKKILPLTIVSLLASCGGGGGHQVENIVENKVENPNTVMPENRSEVQTSPFTYNMKTNELFLRRTKVLDVTDEKYINISIGRDRSETKLNYKNFEKGLRHIKIDGIKVVITRDSRIGKLLQNSYDLKSLEINAQEVVIATVMSLPSTNVTINAKKLTFRGFSSISTKPSFITNSAPQFADGTPGATAGSILLNIEDFKPHDYSIHPFILTGGEGQAAGLGQDGADGLSVDDLGGGVTYLERGVNIPLVSSGPSRIGPSIFGSKYKRESVSGTKVWPTSGGDAISGGRPGEGGQGGNLVSTISISKEFIRNRGGRSGKKARDYRGGRAGTPNPSFHRYYVHNRLKINTKKEFFAGKSVKSPEAISKFGESGKILSMVYETWVTGEYLGQSLKYGNDLFIGNHFKKAYNHFSGLGKLCQSSSQNDSLAALNCLKIRVQLQKLSSNLNFFGERINKMPTLSFEANTKFYRKDIENSLKLIFLSKINAQKRLSFENRLDLYDSAQEELLSGAYEDNLAIGNMNRKVAEINKTITELHNYEEEFRQEIEKVEAEIRRQAENNIISKERKAKLYKVLSSIASVGSVIPIGQPAIGVATQSLSSFMQAMHGGDVISSLKGLRSLYKNVKKIDIEKSSQDWDEGLLKIKYSTLKNELEGASNSKERGDIYDKYLSDVEEIVSPIVKSLTKEMNSYKRISFPRNAVEREVARLKNSDVIFNVLASKLSELIEKRKSTLDALSSVQTNILRSVISIQDRFDQIAKLSFAKQNIILNEEYILTTDFDSIIENAVNRLLSYNYDLYNSIQYTYMGKVNEFNFYESLDEILNKMDVDIRHREEDLDDDVSTYISMFESNFSDVAYKLVDQLDKNKFKYEKEFVIHLARHEVEQLNSGNDLYIDMFKYHYLFENEEGLKVKDIKIIAGYEGPYENTGINKVELVVSHGESHFISAAGKLYELTSSLEYKWGKSIDLRSGRQSDIVASKVNFNTLGALADIDIRELEVFNRAALLGQYKVEYINKASEEVKLTSLSLVVEYEYQ